MKKKIKLVLAGIGGLVVLLLLGVVVKFYALSPKYRPAPVMSAPTTPEAIERGKYLVNNVTGCVACHSNAQETVPGDPPVEGKIGAGRDFGSSGSVHLRAPNITPDKENGIGGWTDGEVARAIREGVSKDGRALFPQMPYTTFRETLSDGEVLDIIAYLRTLKPVADKSEYTTVPFPVSMFIRAVPQPLETPAPPAPSPSDKLARGRWLLKSALCAECHDSVDDHHQKIPDKGLAGGFKFPLPNDKGYVIAPNITSDKATGIGAYSDDDLRRVLTEGKGKSGRSLYVMPWFYYKDMKSEDREALIAALRAAPAVANIVPPSAVK